MCMYVSLFLQHLLGLVFGVIYRYRWLEKLRKKTLGLGVEYLRIKGIRDKNFILILENKNSRFRQEMIFLQ